MIERVRLRNYKSIARCDVALGPLTFLVGRNGAGKSNFLDALSFVTESLGKSLEHAIGDRGPIAHRQPAHNGNAARFAIDLEFTTIGAGSADSRVRYAFEIETAGRSFAVRREECVVSDQAGGHASYLIADGSITLTPSTPAPPHATDRLYLVHAAGLPAFRPAYDKLGSMRFYNLSPALMRVAHRHESGERLRRHGENLASVLRAMSETRPDLLARIADYLRLITPGLIAIEPGTAYDLDVVSFRQRMRDKDGVTLPPESMSDGTMRALGVLVALFQGSDTPGGLGLVGIEEPEGALHPAAAGVLIDALREATDQRQVVLTSHSPDLLDHKSLTADELLAVRTDRGETTIAGVDDVTRSALREHLYTAGELMRMDTINPQPIAGGSKVDE